MTQENSNRIVCLFGSGISIPAGFPDTAGISRLLVPPHDFHRCNNGTYSFDSACAPDWRDRHRFKWEVAECESISRAIEFLKVEAWPLLQAQHEQPLAPTYEDVIYLLHRLVERTPAEPLLNQVTQGIRQRLASILDLEEGLLHDRLAKAIDCVICLLSELLAANQIQSTVHLAFIRNLVETVGPGSLTIVTTNHDTLIEHYLTRAEIPWSDGFPTAGEEANLWRPQILAETPDHVTLLKIHGSINWRRIMPGDLYNFGREVAKMAPDGSLPRRYAGQVFRPLDWTPRIVIGTLDKPDEYLTDVIGDSICLFRHALKHTTSLVVAGYGFKDSGVNRILFEWAFGRLPRRMVVIDRNPMVVEESDLGYWWKQLEAAQVARVVPKGLGYGPDDLVWEDLRKQVLQ